MPKLPTIFNHLKTDFISYVFLGLTLFLVVSLYQNFLRVRRADAKIDSAKAQLTKLEAEKADYERKLKEIGTADFTEAQLRNKLGMAKEGEIVVVLPPEEELRKLIVTAPPEVQDAPEPNWKKWMRLFL